MTSIDIVKIIGACKKYGVEKLEYSGLLLILKDSSEKDDGIAWKPIIQNTPNIVDNREELTHNEESLEENIESYDEFLALSNPLEWEKRQMNG